MPNAHPAFRIIPLSFLPSTPCNKSSVHRQKNSRVRPGQNSGKRSDFAGAKTTRNRKTTSLRPIRLTKLGSLFGQLFKLLGPGMVTGAADDDPSGIATYSSVGAQFGPGMLWTTPFVYPFMAAIQKISARLGREQGMVWPATCGVFIRVGYSM